MKKKSSKLSKCKYPLKLSPVKDINGIFEKKEMIFDILSINIKPN